MLRSILFYRFNLFCVGVCTPSTFVFQDQNYWPYAKMCFHYLANIIETLLCSLLKFLSKTKIMHFTQPNHVLTGILYICFYSITKKTLSTALCGFKTFKQFALPFTNKHRENKQQKQPSQNIYTSCIRAMQLMEH